MFGAMGVAVRMGLDRGGDAEGGAAILAAVAAVTALALAAVTGGEVEPGELWPFVLAGALVPGVSQLVFVQAIRHAGASRALIVVGTAPLLSVLLALVLLDEPFVPALALGTVLVVAAGIVLAGETRPQHVRVLGVRPGAAGRHDVRRPGQHRALGCGEMRPPPLVATAASLVAAAVVVCTWLLVARRSTVRARLARGRGAFAAAGLCLGLAYAALVAGLDSGRVSVVAPLNATQSLWAVVFAALLLRRTEAIGRRVVIAAALVVAGGALIGAFR